ncbi:MAG: T6SS immunity protein Tdi1 domain-containing protein [Actinomycetota bacterium]
MFERFLDTYDAVPDDAEVAPIWDGGGHLLEVPGYEDLMRSSSGRSFGSGIYRLHSAESGARMHAHISAAFPEWARRAVVFGYDWLGRQFAADFGQRGDDGPLIVLLEPGTGEVLTIPAGFQRFHDIELVDQPDAALAAGFFREWSATQAGALPLGHDRCVGYEVPLFLGGQDSIENLEEIDLDVYWTVVGQLIARTRGLEPGTPIDGVSGDG